MKNKLILASMIFISINCFAQNRISVSAFIGICDLRYINPRNVITNVADYYTPSYSYKAGIYYDFIYREPIKLFPTIGFSITGKGVINNVPNTALPHLVGETTTDKFYTFDLPIELNYKLKEWLILKGGVNTSLLFATTSFHGPTEKESFTFGVLGGVSLRYRKYSLNIEYIYDVTDMIKYIDMDMSYKCSLIHIGIGYYF